MLAVSPKYGSMFLGVPKMLAVTPALFSYQHNFRLAQVDPAFVGWSFEINKIK